MRSQVPTVAQIVGCAICSIGSRAGKPSREVGEPGHHPTGKLGTKELGARRSWGGAPLHREAWGQAALGQRAGGQEALEAGHREVRGQGTQGQDVKKGGHLKGYSSDASQNP